MHEMLLSAMEGAHNIVKRQAVNINNLANVSTDGFRKEIVLLQKGERGDQLVSKPDFTPGAIRNTGRSLDVAVAQDGWMKVITSNGTEAFSRRGDLRVNELGQLLNGIGQEILGDGGPIVMPPYSSIEIASDGTVSIIPLGETSTSMVAIDRISLLRPDTTQLRRGNDGMFRLPEGVEAEEDTSLRLIGSSLEGSNVNPIESLVQMIEMSRAFESHVKMMKMAKTQQEQLSQVMNLR